MCGTCGEVIVEGRCQCPRGISGLAGRLRECPFCGSSNVDLWRGQIVGPARDNGMRFVRCLNCGASTAYRQKADAISSWNERAHERSQNMPREVTHNDTRAKHS